MMKRIKKMLRALALAQLLFCTGCKETAVLYDSSETLEAPGEAQAWEEASSETGERKNGPESEEAAMICVYVCGEVANPGVYELEAGSRIGEAVEAAGGMTAEAASTWLNLAEPMTDGQKIEVPSKEREEELLEERESRERGLLNLNTATAKELTALRGIGESKAEDILNYREQHGGFRTIEELMQIPGIKEGVFEKIKDQITV